jgi:ParB family chromosome partitioning protein
MAKKGSGEPRPPRAKPAEKKPSAPRKKPEPKPPALSVGLSPRDLVVKSPPSEVVSLGHAIEADGGCVLATYREPIGGMWSILAALPLDRVSPTPFQRDLSEGHVAKLGEVITKIKRFLDPIIVVRRPDGAYWTPNGNHRRSALERLGAKTVVALVLPDELIAYRILALNTEKAHNVREKALEAVRMARSLAERIPWSEKAFELELEEPLLLTLGLCYEARPRFSGGAYQSILRQLDAFLEERLPEALEIRKARAASLLAVDDAVAQAVDALRARGFESPYLKALVVARVNPLAFHKGAKPTFEDAMTRMLAAAQRFDPAAIRPDQVARAAGPPEE